MKFSVLFLLLLSLNAWSQDGDIERLNRMMTSLESFSFRGDGKVTADPSLWNIETTKIQDGMNSVIYSRVGRKNFHVPAHENANSYSVNNLVQIEYRNGVVSQISQNANSRFYTTAEVENGKIKSFTTCDSTTCSTLDQTFCSDLLKVFKVKSMKEINAKVMECASVNDALTNVQALRTQSGIVASEQSNLKKISTLNGANLTSNKNFKAENIYKTNASLFELYNSVQNCERLYPNDGEVKATSVVPTKPAKNKGSAQ